MMQMQSKIKKWGNSLGIRIPKSVAEKLELTEDSEVDIDHKNGAILIVPLKKDYSLDTLVDQIDSSNLHDADDFASDGKEVW
jgi:antitoxin MazE